MLTTDRGIFEREMNVSRETLERLDYYAQILTKWNKKINLVSRKSISELWTRHFLDSAQIFKLTPENTGKWCDLGSGGGFPGLVLAILALESNKSLQFNLIESDERKTAFLATIVRDLSLNVSVIPQRIEESENQCADVVTARALAPLDKLLEYAVQHGKENGVFLLPKGENYQSELTMAREFWHIDCEVISSITDKNSAILKITGCQRV